MNTLINGTIHIPTTSTTTSPSAVAPVATPSAPELFEASGSFRESFDDTAADRAALAASELVAINLDVSAVTTAVLAAVVQMNALSKDIVSALPAGDVARFAKLGTYAEALAYAQSVYLAASAPVEVLPALAERAIKIRQQLVADASALAVRGLLDAHTLSALKRGNGYMNQASDLGVLAQMFRERWTEVASRSGVQLADLDEAERVSEQITRACAARAVKPATVAAATDDRQRAYTLVLRAHHEARRAVSYVRWHMDDINKLVPSLWAGRGGRGASRGSSGDASAARQTPGVGAAPSAPTSPNLPLSPAPAAPLVEPVEPGHPGGSPFANNGVALHLSTTVSELSHGHPTQSRSRRLAPSQRRRRDVTRA